MLFSGDLRCEQSPPPRRSWHSAMTRSGGASFWVPKDRHGCLVKTIFSAAVQKRCRKKLPLTLEKCCDCSVSSWLQRHGKEVGARALPPAYMAAPSSLPDLPRQLALCYKPSQRFEKPDFVQDDKEARAQARQPACMQLSHCHYGNHKAASSETADCKKFKAKTKDLGDDFARK